MPVADDPFDDIVSGITLSVDDSEVINVQTLSDKDLIDLRDDLTDEIMKTKNLYKNDSDWARDQHSLRAAIIVELARRGFS